MATTQLRAYTLRARSGMPAAKAVKDALNISEKGNGTPDPSGTLDTGTSEHHENNDINKGPDPMSPGGHDSEESDSQDTSFPDIDQGLNRWAEKNPNLVSARHENQGQSLNIVGPRSIAKTARSRSGQKF